MTKTRELLQRNLQLNPEFSAFLSTAWQELDLSDGCKTLAVHVRLGDKEKEAPCNFELTIVDFSDRAAKCCEIYDCNCFCV